MMRTLLAALFAGGLLGLSEGPAGASDTPSGKGLVRESVDCTGVLPGEAIRSNGLAVWIGGEQWLVTSYSSDTVSWSNGSGAGAAKGTTAVCTSGDARITLVKVMRAAGG